MTATELHGSESAIARLRARSALKRYTYLAHGLSLSSAWPLAWLHAIDCADGAPDVSLVRLRPEQVWTPRPRDFVVRDSGHLSVAMAGNRVALWAYCGTKAQFERLSGAQGLRIGVYRPRGLPSDRFEHSLLHVILPNALAASGITVLHAAAVVVRGQAFLFAGESGMGKSTLAAGLAARGYTVLGEDIARVEWRAGQMVTYASYPGARLRSNSFLLEAQGVRVRSGRFGLPKHRVHPEATPATPDPFPVAGVFMLMRSRQVGPVASRLKLAEALPHLLQSAFLQTLPRASRAQEAIERSMRILRSCPIQALSYRRSASDFDAMLERLITLLARGEEKTKEEGL
ncbi:MAG: hypothetical protein ACK4XK_02375 [Casimicrobiaceae bacterium]